MIKVNTDSVRRSKKKTLNRFEIIFFGAIFLSVVDIIVSIFNLSNYVTIVISLIIISLYSIREYVKLDLFLGLTILWFLYNFIHLSNGGNSYFISVIFQQLVWLLFLWIGKNTPIKEEYISKYNFLYIIIIFIASLHMLVSRNVYFSTIIYSCSYFFISLPKKREFQNINTILLIFVFFLTRERSKVLSMVVVLLFTMILPLLSKRLYKIMYWFTVILISVIPYLYTLLYTNPLGQILNVKTRELTGKNLFSGRQEIWVYIEKILLDNQFFGLGGEAIGGKLDVGNILGISTHNLSLFIRMQGGIILLFLFFFFLYKIWMSFYPYIHNKYVLIGAAYFIGLLVRSSFDLVLVANNFVDSFFLWLPIVISLGISKNKETVS